MKGRRRATRRGEKAEGRCEAPETQEQQLRLRDSDALDECGVVRCGFVSGQCGRDGVT